MNLNPLPLNPLPLNPLPLNPTPLNPLPLNPLQIDIHALAADFIANVETCNLEALAAMYAPDGIVNINAIGVDQPAAETFETLRAMHQRAESIRYEVLEVIPTESGYVQRHRLHVVVPQRGDTGPQHLVIPACLVVTLKDGLVARVDEYLDSSQIAPLFQR
ncbi:unannotated protein [freshwater metagenome]|uniref:Unannotated protein n=1 Tax=freshwater metagenome TaxID=449393 RepID=A0A6J6XNP7_9ZZZZ|nr:DUF4440 domain-containing protein [Actinomycetota bacterium]